MSLEQAQKSARLAGLAVLSSLKAALGDLDRVAAWLMVNGFVALPLNLPVVIAAEVDLS